MGNLNLNENKDPNSSLFSLIKSILIYRSVKKIIILTLVFGFILIMMLIGLLGK